MQKQKGFTLLELMLTIVVVGILAGISAPSFQRWQRDQQFTSDTETFFDTLADARASAVSEKKCGDNLAKDWILEVSETGVNLSCTDGNDLIVSVRAREWASPSEITAEVTESLILPVWETEDPLQIKIFTGGTQALIAENYSYKWARVRIYFADIGKTKTICYSRIANYPYYSTDGTCDGEN